MEETIGGRWERRAALSVLVRGAILVVPLLAGALAIELATHVVGGPTTGLALLGWWLVMAALATLVLIGVERLCRRFLPLAALLELSLAFPEKAPSRLRLAHRSSVTELRELLTEVHDHGLGGSTGSAGSAAETVLVLIGTLSIHDRRTRGHSERVRLLADALADELQLDPGDRDRLRWAALLHDIGKLVVPHDVLNKPGPLDHDEWETMRRHPEEGDRVVAPLKGWLGEWGAVIAQHHERYDGTGYPNGLAGDEISWGARIVSVADSYETMTSPRTYRRPVAPAAAREDLARCAGSQFDPEVVRAFCSLSIRRLWLIVGPLAWAAQLPWIARLIRSTEERAAALNLAPTGARMAAAAAVVASVAGVPFNGGPPVQAAGPAVRAGVAPGGDNGAGGLGGTSSRAVLLNRGSGRGGAGGTGTGSGSAFAGSTDLSWSDTGGGDHLVVFTVPGSQSPTVTSRDPSSAVQLGDGGSSPDTGAPAASSPPAPAPNQAPVAADDSAATNVHEPVTIRVLANDSDADGNLDPALVKIVDRPQLGSVQVRPDGTIVYRPHGWRNGVDRFVYRVCDTTAACSTATVTVTTSR